MIKGGGHIMKNLFTILAITIFSVLLSPKSNAADLEVKWTNPDKYRDIRAGQESRKSFKDRTFKSFEKHFTKLAAKLPEDQLLKIEVTDVDLAGDTRFDTISQIRVITELYFPRMKFSYQLINADKSVNTSGEADLKDMSFMNGGRLLRYRNESLSYEKKMLDDWFNETFGDSLKGH